ncbi:MAG: PAS domain S-box protein [Prolixibacteraceae bacterium]
MRIRNIRNFLFGTLRGRLILSVAIVNAAIMTLFIIYLTNRQRNMLIERQEEEAITFSQTLSTSAAGWLAAYDIAGLQELADAQRRYPELIFAILTDNEGHILAHTNRDKNGQFLLDLPIDARLTVISKTPDLVDVAVPAMLGGMHVGWARIGLGQEIVGTKLAKISQIGALYALAAILIGSVIVWLMGRRITRRLYVIQKTINEVGTGNRSARSQLSGTDEASMLAHEFNKMLDILSERDAELSDSEVRFKKLFNLAAMPMGLIDKNGGVVGINEYFVQTFGYTLEDIPTIKEWWQLATPDPDYRQEVIEQWDNSVNLALSKNTNIEPGEYRICCKSGEMRTMIISGTIIGDELLATFFDITEHKKAEETILKTNRLYAVISQINQTIIRIDDKDKLFEEVCRIAIEYGKFQMAWIGLVDEETKIVNPIAFAGIEDGYLSNIKEISVDDIPEGLGPTGTALRTGQYSVCNHIPNSPLMIPWKEEALKRGYLSSIALPVKPFGKVIGAFSIYASTTNFFDQSEIELLDEVTKDISFAIEVIETEKKRVETERLLQLSDMRFKLFMRNFPGLAYMKDSEGKVVFANEGFKHYLEMDPVTMIGKTNDVLFPAEFAEKITSRDRQVLNIGQNETVEEVFAGRNWMTYKFPIQQIGESPLLGGFTIDITERKRNEALLTENNERYKAFIAVSNTGAWEYHKDSDFLWCSPEYFSMLGLDINQFDLSGASNLNETWTELIHIEDRQRASSYFSDYLKNDSVEMYENYFRMKHSDGHWVWILSRGRTLRDENGKATNLTVGTHIDITERKRTEDALRKSEAIQSKMVANIGDVIDIIDKDGINRYKSPNIEKWFGWKPEDINNTSIWKNVHPEDVKPLQKIFRSIIHKPNATHTTECRYRCKDGSYKWIEFTGINLIHDPDILGILGNYHDISERKQAELNLKEKNEHIEAQNEKYIQINKELAFQNEEKEKQAAELILAKEKAEESDRLKSAFLANMSHEVRTPLNSIIGFSELLADSFFEEDQKKGFIQNIINNGYSLLSIISDIMDISRLESGEIKIHTSQINAQKIISSVMEQFSVGAEGNKLEFKLNLPDNGKETIIFADVYRLRQILNNLMSNAIKFTTNGRIEMGYQTKGKMVEFYVRDTGIGIPAEYHELIFERFRQVESSTTREFGGNGLGLAISKNLVELMGGKIWLESESGKGSVFYFTLPTYHREI